MHFCTWYHKWIFGCIPLSIPFLRTLMGSWKNSPSQLTYLKSTRSRPNDNYSGLCIFSVLTFDHFPFDHPKYQLTTTIKWVFRKDCTCPDALAVKCQVWNYFSSLFILHFYMFIFLNISKDIFASSVETDVQNVIYSLKM